jgi:ubiquinone/menaquinone biosynthesis C-methylase UbiE
MMETGTALYDSIGTGYDTTRRADPFLVSRLRHHLHPRPEGRYLDLACGTGNYTLALATSGGAWVGVDCSATMIAQAGEKSSAVNWCIADAASLPIANDSLSGAVCVLAVHHFGNIFASFAEVRRTLKQGSRFVLFTSDPQQMEGCWLNAYFPRAMARSMEVMPEADALAQAMQRVGIEPVGREPYTVHPELEDFFLYSGKHDPARYLDPRFRAGISTFAVFADTEEIDRGCTLLADDIASGRIDEIRECYASVYGDYLFLVGEAV